MKKENASGATVQERIDGLGRRMASGEEGNRAGRQGSLLLFFQTCPNRLHRPWLLRELACLELGVDQVAVDTQFETPTAGRNQLQLADLLLVGGQELARQTDGLRLIVSHRTVFE